MTNASASTLNLEPRTSNRPSSIRFTDGERRAFRARETDPRTGKPLTVSQWAERYRMVTDGALKGRWQNVNSPYAVEIMDLWTDPSVREIYICAAPQIVKTQIAFNCAGYSIDQDPAGIMYVMPDEKTTKRIARTRILPMIKASPRLAELLSPRYDDTTTLAIRFKNGADIMMAWATSVAELSSEPRRYVIGDEVSKFPGYASGQNKKESSPIDLLRFRANSFPHTSKALFISSPGEDPCAITDLMHTDADEVRRLEVPCPICGHFQIMDDEHIVITHNTTDPRVIVRDNLARYACDKCGMYWDDYTRVRAVRNGRWVSGQYDQDDQWQRSPRILRPVAVAFHLPSWYGVNTLLSKVAAAKIRANDGPEKRQVYTIGHKAERYKEVIETKRESKILEEHKTSLPSQIVPANALALVCGIDSHTWGYRFAVCAAIEDTIGFTIQKIHHGHLGSLADIENLIYHGRYQIEASSETMGIWRAGIDTGGSKSGPDSTDKEKSMTSEIYDWLRKQPRTGTINGIKGASQQQSKGVKLTTIDSFPHSNKPILGGLELRLIDTSRFKAWLHWRLTRTPDETQRFLMDADTDNDFVRELLAEEQKKQRGRVQWVKVRSANHYLDTIVYCLAMIDGEWQPSLKLMATYIKQARAQGAGIRDQGAANKEQEDARQASQHRGRPDISSIRERLADRFSR
jgi:phage terminase large subunit GpA-like protein